MSFSKPRPYLTLEAWRGFAALWVVLSHSCLSTPFQQVSPFVTQYQGFYLFSLAGYLGVQIFFVISGYCIAASVVSALAKPNGLTSFVQARLRRIYPPYFFAMALVVLCSQLAAVVFGNRPEFAASVLAHLNFFYRPTAYYLTNLTLTTQPLQQTAILPISWTLNYEIAFYALMSLALLAATRRRDKFLLLNSLHLITVVSLLLLLFKPLGILFPFDLWPQFGLGILAYDLLTHPGRILPQRVTAVVVLEILLYTMIYSLAGPGSVFEHWRHSIYSSRIVFSLAFFAVLLLLYRHDEALSQQRGVRFLAWIGGFSYTLYLIHFLCVNTLSIVGDILGVTALAFPLLYCCKVIVAVLFARALFPLMEKPFMHAKPKVLLEPLQATALR